MLGSFPLVDPYYECRHPDEAPRGGLEMKNSIKTPWKPCLGEDFRG